VKSLIHIRSRTDGKYLYDNGKWSSRISAARMFSTTKEAADFCRAERLKTVEIVILRDNQPPSYLPIDSV
jgi:hypothetical protein